jgi:monolysocardiolipin acyltransferase
MGRWTPAVWAVRSLAAAAAVAGGRCAYVAHYYRPVPDYSPGERHAPTKRRLLDTADEPGTLLLARQVTLTVGTAVSKILVGWLNSLVVVEDRRYHAWLEAVRSRPARVPLITVANHESCCDDPPLMGGLVPWDVAVDPHRMRWGICTQEMCFSPRYFSVVHALAGCGQALPIRRGGGVDQPLLYDIARQIAAGCWVHVFPEGRVVQGSSLGLDPLTTRSSEDLAIKGRLKWGVGKLIAHSPVPPVILPFHHKGMAGVMPQRNVLVQGPDGDWLYDNKVISPLPRTGAVVVVRFGDAICVDDLVKEYEDLHGPLYKVGSAPGSAVEEAVPHRWESSPEELMLYQAITLRIEKALLSLEEEAMRGWPGPPDVCPRPKSVAVPLTDRAAQGD